MKVVINNTDLFKTKEVMSNLLNCVKDKSLPISERNYYYSEYLKISANYLIQSK